MKYLHVFLRKHFHCKFSAYWLILTWHILLPKSVTQESTDDTKIFEEKWGDTKFDNLVVDVNRKAYIGAVNRLYQLSYNLKLIANFSIDLKSRISLNCTDCPSNADRKSIVNHNKILVWNTHSPSQLISCWSISGGLCKIYHIKYDSLEEVKSLYEPMVSDGEDASTVAFIAPGPTSNHQESQDEEIPALYVGVTNTNPVNQNKLIIPAITARSLQENNTFKVIENGSIIFQDTFRGKYAVNYIHGFSSGSYNFFLTNQMESVQPSSYVSKLIRICQQDSSYRSYAEIPIECIGEDGTRYNLAQAAFVGNPGDSLAYSLGISSSQEVLFAIFAQNKQTTVGYESSKPNNNSALCVYSLKQINEKFIQNIQNCFSGTGYRGLEFMISPNQECVKDKTIIDSEFCGADVNMPLEGKLPITTNASITFDTLVSAVNAQAYQREFTSVFLGTSTGHLMLIRMENKFRVCIYKKILIDEGFAINPDLYYDLTANYLYIMTNRKLMKKKILFPKTSITSVKPTVGLRREHVNITIRGENLGCFGDIEHRMSIHVGDMLCIPYEELCKPMEEIVCTIDTTESSKSDDLTVVMELGETRTYAEERFKIIDPIIDSISPSEGSVYGGTNLFITGSQLDFGKSLNVSIGNIPCIIVHRKENEIKCITSESLIVMEDEVAVIFEQDIRITSYPYRYSYIHHTDRDDNGFNLIAKSIPAGGIAVLMNVEKPMGLDMKSIRAWFFQVNNASQTYSSTKCKVQENGVSVICLSPYIPEIDSNLIHVENPPILNYTLIASLDRMNRGGTEKHSLINLKSGKFTLYPNPIFQHVLITEYGTNFRFIIKGQNLDNACQIHDFIVWIGKENCKVISLTRMELICELAKSAVRHDYSKNADEKKYGDLNVYENVIMQIGNNSKSNAKQVVPYFETVSSDDKPKFDWIMYAVYSGVFIFIIVFLVLMKILMVYRKKSIKNSKKSKELQQQINKMGLDAIAMRQCMKQIVVDKDINMDGSLAHALKFPNIAIEYAPVSEYLLPPDTKWEFPRNKLTFGKFLGEGEFGRVVQGEAVGIIDENIVTLVAIKMLKETHSDTDMLDLVSEMETLKLIGIHDNVLRLLGCCSQNGPLLIITEYAPHGNLLDFLREHHSSVNSEIVSSELPPSTLIKFGLQIARGMEYLASMKCVHRDLAARNVLVSDNYILKIADFGLARDIRSKDYYRKKSGGRLPVKWMAPEALHRSLYTTESDVWSYGVVLWEIMSLGALPYPTFTDIAKLVEDLHSGYRMERPQNCSMEIYNIMNKCWNYSANGRPTFSVIVENLEEILWNINDGEVMNDTPQNIDILKDSDSYDSSHSDISENVDEIVEEDHLLG